MTTTKTTIDVRTQMRLVFEAGYAQWIEDEDESSPIVRVQTDPRDILGHRLQITTKDGRMCFISKYDPRIEFRDGTIWSSDAWRKDPLWYLSPIYAQNCD